MPDPTDAPDAAAQPAETSPAETDEPAPVEFANRAARRAKGKGAGAPASHGRGKVGGRQGTVQGPRQWGNRRSG
jgi:hypothetical protein